MWGNQNSQLLIAQGGGLTGLFIYNGFGAPGNPPIVSATDGTTDPFGNPVPQGIATYNTHGAVLFLQSTANNATFFYQDTGSAVQGTRVLSIASAAGVDPVIGTAYPAGQQGIDPAFGDFITLVGANIDLGLLVYSRNAKLSVGAGSGATRPKLQLDAPEQGVSGHLQIQMAGTSPDGTHPSQLTIGQVATGGTLTPVTLGLYEVQGSITMLAIAAPAAESGAAVIYADTNRIMRAIDSSADIYCMQQKIKHITADQVINSTTPAIVGANSTPLSFAMVANVTYRFRAVIEWTQGATQAQQAFRLIGTGSLTLGNMRVEVSQVQQSTGGQSVFQDVLASLNTDNAVVGASGFANGADIVTEFDGVITPNVGGTLNLEARCVTSGADTYTIRSWSFAQVMPE